MEQEIKILSKYKTCSFTIFIPELSDVTLEASDNLYDAGCDDGLLFRQFGAVGMSIESAKNDIKSAGYIPGEVILEDEV